MKVTCPHCQSTFEEDYYKIGMPARCSDCQKWFPLLPEHIVKFGETGYQITCDDFRQLLREPMSAADIEAHVTAPVQRHSALGPMLAVPDAEQGWVFCSPDRKDWYDPCVLHTVIQKFSAPQQKIYQYAMSKWR